MESLEEMLKDFSAEPDKLYVNADVDVIVKKDVLSEETKEEEKVLANDSSADGEKEENKEVKADEDRELTIEEAAALVKKEAMDKLGEYEALENKKVILAGELQKAQDELESLFTKLKAENIGLVDKINELTNELEATEDGQAKVKEELLPLQRELYLANEKDKTLVYNKIQSTFVAETEKNSFDLKKFREEQAEFWKSNYDLLMPYAKISEVAAYLKITIKK